MSNEYDHSHEQEQELLLAYVNKNKEFYNQKWKKSKNPQTSSSWNWPAFFFGPLWLAYRKMYLFSFLYMFAYLIVDWLIVSELFGYGLSFVTMVLFGLFGNAVYYRHAKKAVQSYSKSELPTEETSTILAAKGSTTIWGVVIATIVLFTLTGVSVFFPRGYEYADITFGTSEDGLDFTEETTEFAEGEEIYYWAYFGKALNTSLVDVYLTKVTEKTEEVIESWEMEVVPSWGDFFTFLDDEEDGMSSLESGDYILSIAKDDEIIAEGAFSVY